MVKRKRSAQGYSKRKVDTREVRQRFLIVCEGEKTEPNYFRSFRVPKNIAVVNIRGLGRNPSRLVNSAENLSTQDEYDQIWCVFDRDEWSSEEFNRAIEKAEKLKFGVAYSNEAFELWYVLHFEFLNAAIPRSDYSKKLTSLMGQRYEKNSDTIYDTLIAAQSTAIKNAEKLLEQYVPCNPAQDNPSTTVHLLVKELNRFMP